MANEYAPNPETFVIPIEGNLKYLIYAPLSGVAMRASEGVIDLLKRFEEDKVLSTSEREIVNKLKKSHILINSEERKEFDKHTQQQIDESPSRFYKPTSVTLMPTFDCSLRCVYCYSEGGERVTSPMSQEIAKSAIDLVIRNASKTFSKRASLSFHGGGEPFFPITLPLVKNMVAYFKNSCIKEGIIPRITSATNGLIKQKNLDWITQSFDYLNISLDGPEDIQNSQRPMPNGKPSYESVLRTISYLNEKSFPFSLRATITHQSVSRMEEILRLFHEIAPRNNSFHFENLSSCGRCYSSTEFLPATDEEFLNNYLTSQKVARQLGVKIYNSTSSLDSISDNFCGATGDNFIVTPEGNATTCLEVCRETDIAKEIFFIGKYNVKTNSFEFNQNKINALRRRKVQNLEECVDCFAKYNCSGDCPAKVFRSTGSIFDSGSYRCDLNRGLLLAELLERTK